MYIQSPSSPMLPVIAHPFRSYPKVYFMSDVRISYIYVDTNLESVAIYI